ncbi:MAG: ribose transport system permease protein, partial [Verrucomicrobiota bacterium]
MAGVLLLLCIFFSWVTRTEQQPRGLAAARRLAGQLDRQASKGATVLLVGKGTDDDSAFLTALESRLSASGVNVVAKVQGEPRDARQALQKLADANRRLDFIATTAECAAWTVLDDLPGKFPALGGPEIVFARSFRWPTFLNSDNLLNVANQISVVAIVAAGMTMVIVAGGIDLSVGSLIALSAVVCTLLIRHFGGPQASGAVMIACGAAGVLATGLVGVLSGLTITAFRVPPFIATLAMMLVASGFAFKLAKGQSVYEVPDAFTGLGRGSMFFSIPNAVILMAAIFSSAHILMSRTKFGRYIYAVGGNAEAARLSGVSVGSVRVAAYGICGALAGLSGVMLSSQLKSGAPTYGTGYELDIIAAVVVGGTSLSGGEGRIFGSLIGAFIIGVIRNGMNLTGVESYDQKVVLGLVILGAVLLDQAKRRRWRIPGWLTGR